MSSKLNYGCGETKLEGFINVDIEDSVKPDLTCDVRNLPLPFDNDSMDEIYCIHNLEHIEYIHWEKMFMEFWRVLEPNGTLVLAYPEFELCAKYFLENSHGMRDFFRATLYGRQAYPGDYHVTPVVSSLLLQELMNWGFAKIRYAPEYDQPFNTILRCEKGKHTSRETIFQEGLFKMGT